MFSFLLPTVDKKEPTSPTLSFFFRNIVDKQTFMVHINPFSLSFSNKRNPKSVSF